ncbi:MAG: response regulator, partial [Anaerolineae bacterium]|nr:response regulator [Anaerolineae bacterium]
DISERKSLEDRLLHSQKMDAVGQLAGGVAHDFNNLLTAINGYSDLLLARMPADAPWRGELNEIRKAGERAEGLTKHLLAFSRRQILNPEILDLNEVVANLEKMLRRVIGENIVLEVRPAPGLHKVKADRGQIEQVLVNLAVNSRDAMPLGGRLVITCGNATERGALPMSMQGGCQAAVVLSVTDTGHGLDEETCNRVFEPFFTTKEKGKGTGLGLSTVYGIIRQSGGDTTVVSEPGKGATFSIFLPAVLEETSPVIVDDSDLESSAPGSEHILLVEDDAQVRDFMKTVLVEKGYRLTVASDGREGLARANECLDPIDLLVTDVIMPDMSGAELARKLVELKPATKVLFVSGYTDGALERHGLTTEVD